MTAPSPKSPITVPASLPAPVTMLNLITGYWNSQMIHVAARLGVADLIKDGPKSAAELATLTGSHAESLYRVLRALASLGVFAEDAEGRFTLTELGATLRSDAPFSMLGFAKMMIAGYNWDSWKELAHSVKTGEIALDKVFGMNAWEYMQKHPEDAKEFGESMTSISRMENPAVAMAYDYSRFRTLVDIGGGHGSLLSSILRLAPKLTGVVFDNPHVIENARKDEHITARDVADRIQCVGGDFFAEVPAGGDAYMMKYIMHDWNDELAGRILGNVRKVIPADGTLLIVDNVIPPGNDPQWGKVLDINMLVLTGGKERTERQFGELLDGAGFTLTRVLPTLCPLSIVEAKPR